MHKQQDRIVQIEDSLIRGRLDLTKVILSQEQKEFDKITDLKQKSQALNTFKLFEQESEKYIYKVFEFTKYFETMKEQSQSLTNHISEVQTSANNIKKEIDSQIYQKSQMNEQGNDLRSYCEQTLNQMMPLLEQSKEKINQINKYDICEIKALKCPPQLISKYLQILIKTLYNVRNLEYRNLLKYLQDPQKLLFDWIDFNIENITDEQINYIRAELNLEEEQRVRNISRFTYSIYYWLRMLIQVNSEFQAIRPAKAQLQLLNSNIQEINKVIQEKEQELTLILDKVQKLQLKLTQLNGLINENQLQYDDEVVQRSAFQVVRKTIDKFETKVRQLEIEFENVDILAFVESAYNQELKQYESNKCESIIGKLGSPITLGKPIEYKLNYCYSNSDSKVVFVFDPYQVGRIIFEVMSQKAQSVCLSTGIEQQIVESSQIIHFIHNQHELSQSIQGDNKQEKRQLFFIFDRQLLEQLKQVSMDDFVNLDLNEQDLAYIYSNYSLNQQQTIGLQKHNDKFKDLVNVLLNILNTNEFENSYQLISDFQVDYKSEWLTLSQLDEDLPLFCSKLYFLLRGKTEIQFREIADSILNVYHNKPNTPNVYSFKYAFDYSIQYMALSQTLVQLFDDKSEQTLLGLLIHKASLNKEFELNEEEQQYLQKCYVFCSEFLIFSECNIFELISIYLQQKLIYNDCISEIIQEQDQVSQILECILKQRERSKVLLSLIQDNQKLDFTITKESNEIEELTIQIDVLNENIRDNQNIINFKENQLTDLNKKLTNQDKDLIYSEMNYLTRPADPDQIVFELFQLLMILIDKDTTWASIQYNTNSIVKINIFNNYSINKININFVNKYDIFTKNLQKQTLIQQSNSQTQKLFKFLQILRQKYDLNQEKLQIEKQLINCKQIQVQNNLELQKQQKIMAELQKTIKPNRNKHQETKELIQIEVNVQDSLNNNLWFENHINQIHQSKQHSLNFIHEQQIPLCMYQSCEKQFQESFLRIQMKQELQIQQSMRECQLLNSKKFMDFILNIQFALQFQANLNLKQLNLEQQYYQNSQIYKFKLIQSIELIEIENLSTDYLKLFDKELHQSIINMNKNIKINQYKLELLTERLLEFTVGLAMILNQSHDVEYRLSLDFISEFIQQFYLKQSLSRNDYLKKLISSGSTMVNGDNLGNFYIQIFILFIYIYQPGRISKLEIAQSLMQDFRKLSILEQIKPSNSLTSIKHDLDDHLEKIFGEDRFRFCEL